MDSFPKIKKEFEKRRSELFFKKELLENSYRFCVAYSSLVEEFIFKAVRFKKNNLALACAGSFCRRELSPFSDIDIMFISPLIEENEEEIKEIVANLWDCGVEASHTVREYSDIEKYVKDDLHTFTQFFETRFLGGDESVYVEWQRRLLNSLTDDHIKELIYEFFNDIENRYQKYGSSAKALEPNVKLTAGGLRDLQSVEWMYSLRYKTLLANPIETAQAEDFIKILIDSGVSSPTECAAVLKSYEFILNIRNRLHLIGYQRNDRLEFDAQEKIAKEFGYKGDLVSRDLMKRYFDSANIILRFSRTMRRRFDEEISNPLSDYLAVQLDHEFLLKEKTISALNKSELDLPEILKAFYYRGVYSGSFDESLRNAVIESCRKLKESPASTKNIAYFREILRMTKNVGDTLHNMNELGALESTLPIFKDMIGFFQPGVYHCYTADEHTLIAIKNVEKLWGKETLLGKIFTGLKNKEILYLAILLHDIGKPHSLSGHEIIGAELAATAMHRLGYSGEEIKLVSSLVKNHLLMEQTAFRRNLSDPETLNNFISNFNSLEELDMLYLLTYADLSAVNIMVWTQWKSDLLEELYRKSREMIGAQISGEELLLLKTFNGEKKFGDASKDLREHIESINEFGYTQHFTEKEIESHYSEILKGSSISVFFKESGGYTNITIITYDQESILSKLCGALSINDLNIHDAKIFTRKDGVVIDSFNVTEFRTNMPVPSDKYEIIKEYLTNVVEGSIELNSEFNRMKSKWKRIERKFFKRTGKINVVFEEHEKYTIIDVFSPDRIGLLYKITKKMNDLGLSIYIAIIATKADDVVDTFYLLDRSGRKIAQSNYEFIKQQLIETIKEMM